MADRNWRVLSPCPRCGITVPRYWSGAPDGRELDCELCGHRWLIDDDQGGARDGPSHRDEP